MILRQRPALRVLYTKPVLVASLSALLCVLCGNYIHLYQLLEELTWLVNCVLHSDLEHLEPECKVPASHALLFTLLYQGLMSFCRTKFCCEEYSNQHAHSPVFTLLVLLTEHTLQLHF